MKIVFLLQDTGSVYGAERATIDLARGLSTTGTSVHALLIVETRLGIEHSKLQDSFAAAAVPFSTVTTASRFSRKLAADIAAELRRVSATILHSTGYKADLHGLFAARAVKIPQVSTVHGWLFRPDLKEQFYAWLNVWAFKRCARVIALSSYYERRLRSKGVPHVVRIPTGFTAAGTPHISNREGATKRPFTFGILGRLSWEKNHALFLDAAAELCRRNIPADFVIAGEGPLSGNLKTHITNLKLPVEMTGYVPSADFFARVDALVLCSRIENQPLVVMEAMACGVPVIATNVGGLPDLVEEGVTGRLVSSCDAQALADAMESFVRNPGECVAFAAAAREKLIRAFGHEQWIARHIELYRGL